MRESILLFVSIIPERGLCIVADMVVRCYSDAWRFEHVAHLIEGGCIHDKMIMNSTVSGLQTLRLVLTNFT
jgi:hypothetical protein